MKELMTNAVSIFLGVLIIIFRKKLARETIEGQKTFPWGSNFGEKEVRITELVIILVGISFIIFGIGLLLT